MRTIKFRGKRVDKDEFVFGDLLTGMGYKKGKFYILPHLTHYPSDCNSLDGYEVMPETVGQFTGLYDKDGKEIYEGDIYRYENPDSINEVCYCIGGGFAGFDFAPAYHDENKLLNVEIIGNIHDNPELLEGGDQ